MKDGNDEHALLLRVEEVGRLMGLGSTKVRELIGSGELEAVRIGRAVRVPRRALTRWLDARSPNSEVRGRA